MKQFYLPHTFLSYIFHKPTTSLFLLLLLIPILSQAQLQRQWDNVFDLPASRALVAVGSDQNPVFLSGGVNQDSQSSELIKLGPDGNTIWTLHLPENNYRLEMDEQDNSYVLSQNTFTKINPSGQIIWQHDLTQYGTWWVSTFKLDNAGSAYIAGFTGDSIVSVLKINSTNQKVWLQQLPIVSRTFNLYITVGDGVYVGGTDQDTNLIVHATFYKLDKDTGANLFNRTIGETGNRIFLRDLQWHDSGQLYVFMDEGPVSFGHTSLLIHKYDPDGNLIWGKNFLYESRDYYKAATFDANGNIFLLTLEQLRDETVSSGLGISKISPGGETIWHYTYSAPSGHGTSGFGIEQLSNGNIAVASNSADINDRQIILTQLYSPDGNLLSEDGYLPVTSAEVWGLGIAPDEQGNLYLAGHDGEKLLTIKYTGNIACTTPNVIVKSDVIDCVTNTAQLQSATNATNATFSWSGPNGYTSTEQNPIVTEPGDYTLTIATGENCSASATVTVLPPNTPAVCYTIDFENATTGFISLTQTKAGSVAVMGQPRSGDGYLPQNYAAIFESGMPTGDDDDLYTDDWGKVLIINETLQGEPNDNRTGGLLLIDFAQIGPVTLQSLKALDVDAYEDDCWVALYDVDENELFRAQLQPLGDNSKQTIDLGNTPNVMRMRVFLGGTEGEVGSAAIDDIKFCIENAPCEEATTIAANAFATPTLFSDKTTILYKPTQTETYEANLYDLQGNLVRQLSKGTATAGEQQQIEIQAGNLQNGLYFARIVSLSATETVKLILNR